jgi:hypothetical protein
MGKHADQQIEELRNSQDGVVRTIVDFLVGTKSEKPEGGHDLPKDVEVAENGDLIYTGNEESAPD